MTKLRTLRSQLASLRASRQRMRWGTGYAALAIAILWILLAIFFIDITFHFRGVPLDDYARAVLLVLGVIGLVWAAMKFTAPFLGHEETDIDMALLVERQHGIDSDLVAALQFESEDADQWGSRELEDAVVDYVAQLDRGLNVYEGISHEEFYHRIGILAATVALVVGLVAIFPSFAHAFVMRLALDDIHYPSRTLIERVLVNGDETLQRKLHGTSPEAATAVEGRSVVFATLVDGEIPSEGKVEFMSPGSGARELPLTAVDRNEFGDVVEMLTAHIHPGSPKPKRELSQLTSDERNSAANTIAALSTFDVAKVEQALEAGDRYDPTLAQIWRQLKHLNDAWQPETDEASESAPQLFVAKLPRLLDPSSYIVRLGDAWTDEATISMTALPVIEPRFTEVVPTYAQRGGDGRSDPTALQRSVIEGSKLHLAIASSKPLKSATFRIRAESGADEDVQIGFAKANKAQTKQHWPTPHSEQPPTEVWLLDPAGSVLADVKGPFRYEIQVTDKDDLSLETPLRGAVRLRADRPPRISGSLVHRAVLPSATPEVEIRADDDYGIDSMNVHVTVRKGEQAIVEGEEIPAGEEATFPVKTLYPLRGDMGPTAAAGRNGITVSYPLQGRELPAAGAYKLDLSKLALQRGDQVRIVLEAIDYRGSPGVSSQSEPILLDITDESGILAGISEGDRRSQEQIDDLIRRQLGIGEVD